MFQSYEYQKYLGTDPETKQVRYQFKIIDSDFEEIVDGAGGVVSLIEVYENRKLRVAPNLIAAILYHYKKHPYYSIQQIIEWNKRHNHKFAKYEKEVLARLEKLLPLL